MTYTEANVTARFMDVLKRYEDGKTNLGNPPVAMFDDKGEFDPHNWNSGQDPRAILCERNVFDERLDEPFEAWYDEEIGEHIIDRGVFWSGAKWHENQTYIFLNVITNGVTINDDTYFISWYRSRGCTEIFTKNGRPIALDEYAALLNVLEKAGFFNNAL